MGNANKKPTILASDPSLTAWGFAVLQNNLVLEAGCIKTEPEAKKRRIREGDDRVRRTTEIVIALMRAIDEHDIAFMVCELPHGSQNAKAAIMMGVVTGVMTGISVCTGIPIEWFSENDAKKSLFSRKTVSKQDVIDAIDELYDVPWRGIKFRDEAVADALAIYYAAECHSSMLKILNR